MSVELLGATLFALAFRIYVVTGDIKTIVFAFTFFIPGISTFIYVMSNGNKTSKI